MSSHDPSSPVDEAYGHLDDVQTQVPGSVPDTTSRLEALRGSLEEYETMADQSEKRDLLDRIEGELADLRESVENEVDDGSDALHDALDRTEERIGALRDELGSDSGSDAGAN